MSPLRASRCMSSIATFSSDINAQLRSMIKPFLLKCHPDVHVASSSKKINLSAVQNLNAFIDTIHGISNGKYKQQDSNEKGSDRIVEIDFVILVDNDRIKRKKKDVQSEKIASRRKVELTLPPQQLCINLANYSSSITTLNSDQIRSIQQLQRRLMQHTRQELVKLLRIAGLSDETIEESSRDIDEMIVDDIFGGDYEYQDNPYGSYTTPPPSASNSNAFRRSHNVRMRKRPRTPYEISRDNYTANFPWHDFRKRYDEAVAEMNADIITHGMISKHAGRRRAMIARILSNLRIQSSVSNDGNEPEQPTVSFVEQLVAFRRLTILLDNNFDKLQMEEFGKMWESSRIVLTERRQYNTSPSALFRRKAAMRTSDDDSASNTSATGFSFTLHPNLSVTISIPVDFRDDELIDELDSNVWDFYHFISDGKKDFFQQKSSV